MDSRDDRELNALLREWQAPGAPASLEARVERARLPWWRQVLAYKIPVPAPIAVALALWMVYGFWRLEVRPAASCASPAVAVQQPAPEGPCGSVDVRC